MVESKNTQKRVTKKGVCDGKDKKETRRNAKEWYFSWKTGKECEELRNSFLQESKMDGFSWEGMGWKGWNREE